MAGDLIIEHVSGTLSYVHDEVQPEPDTLEIVQYQEGADVYVRSGKIAHRFVGRVSPVMRDTISRDCKRAVATYIPGDLVEEIVRVSLKQGSHKEFQAGQSEEVTSAWKSYVEKNGCNAQTASEGLDVLSEAVRRLVAAEAGYGPFVDLLKVKNALDRNGSLREFNEVIGQPIGGLAGTHTINALNDFLSSAVVRL